MQDTRHYLEAHRQTKMAPAVRSLSSCRVDSFFYANITCWGVLPSICTNTTYFIILNYGSVNPFFPIYTNWKTIVKTKILEEEVNDWYLFCTHHPSMRVAPECLEHVSP